jgi:hypothetical protein
MKLFQCQNCGQPLYFENTRCESCGSTLGYQPTRETVMALRQNGRQWTAVAAPGLGYRFCANAVYGVCNWLITVERTDQFCAACRHNRTIPDLSQRNNQVHWRLMEAAKHRLFYTLLKLKLPLASRAEDPKGLAFDFIADSAAPVLTGHENGLITINLAEADDAERERRRHQMGEPYRTLLGHFRHEIAHYYWIRLVANSLSLEQFREVFGDERRDYGGALQDYYTRGAPADWPERFVSAHAVSHPWEDFAETWAHYFHIVDTLETANAFGLIVKPKLPQSLAAKTYFDPHDSDLDRLIGSWLPLTFAVNSINRSMGLHDLYPFVLSPPAIAKLAFVHERVRAQAGLSTAPESGLHAMIAGLRQRA